MENQIQTPPEPKNRDSPKTIFLHLLEESRGNHQAHVYGKREVTMARGAPESSPRVTHSLGAKSIIQTLTVISPQKEAQMCRVIEEPFLKWRDKKKKNSKPNGKL